MSETLQEFLVKIKYQTDKASETQALSGVKNAGVALLKLGAAAVAVGGAIAASTLKYAQGMNSTYLATQRMGMGIKQMRAMSKAAEELGGSVGDMQSSMNGFASFMRRNPFGSVDFLAGMGVKVGKGESRDKTLNKIAKRFQGMPEYMAIQYGEQMGMSESAVLSMRDPKFQGLQAQHMAAMGKGDFQAAGKQANEVIKSYDLMVDHFDASMTKGMLPALNAAPTAIDKVSQAIDELDPRLVATATAFSSVSGALAGLGAGLLALSGAKSLLGGGAAGTAARTGGKLLAGAKLATGAGMMLYSEGLNKGEDSKFSSMKQNHAMYMLMQGGMSKEQAAGVVANLTRESRLNARAVGDGGKAYGIGQWHPDRQANFAKVFGHSMHDSTLDEQLRFVQWELANTESGAGRKLKAAGSARLAGEVISRNYERPAATASEAAARGALAEHLAANYHTTINVHGVNDPKAAADYVAQAQTRVYQQNARNQQGATR